MTKAQPVNTGSGTKRSKRSSLIAKCTAPFTANQRSQVEQEIRLDEPFRQYAPGDSVKGAIHLTFGKPIRITHLVVRLHGFVKVSNRAKLPGEEISYDESLRSLGNGSGRQGTEYFGSGFARLFEDEEILCGEGRVLGRYEFRFEMVLPSKNMPSSIDFEHGTISYLITSTVTRPTAISPTSVQHFKLRVQDIIDIAPIQKPKPVALSMETSHKKGRPKIGGNRKNVPSNSARTSKSSSHDSTNGPPTLDPTIHSQNIEAPPRSPVPSEISATTATTSSTSSNPPSSGDLSACMVNNAAEDVMANFGPNTVSVKTEVLQGGCLAGDHLPIRISIKHNKFFKSMQGIIVSLYRQGRIDVNPDLPIGPFHKNEKRRHEEYFPRSLTGLAGLSLSSAGSTRSFRQELAQIVAPIIIDPQSLTAVINTSIEAPPHLFPSITNVPGALVSFKYFVEIVVDLRGKLSGQDRLRPHLSITNAPQHGYGDSKVSQWEGSDGVNYHSAPAFNYIITDQLRRTRGTISTRTEIIVGSRDTRRKRGKQSDDRPAQPVITPLRSSVEMGREEDADFSNNRSSAHDRISESRRQQQSIVVPPPDPEGDLDEKAQMRRAEQRLVPSAPPPIDNQNSLSAALIPSAPPASDVEDFVQRYGPGAPAPAYDGPSSNLNSIGSSQGQLLQGPAGAQGDKQELERQRLLALASSPPSGPDAVGETPRALLPSAPVLYEDDIFSINDPRIPESSPADFVDERVTFEGDPICHEPPPQSDEDNPLHDANDSQGHENNDVDDNDDFHEPIPNNDHDLCNDSPPVYRR